ncbi:MAG: hypothetical protein COV48_06300 [Elusimicrobia bacterium CG11_big_fil_rev_8_21_14_0_20_64_6]|nr:MAG: hypothetical protein COV48_06300 [Elusimicrobia bacterium CG11_big_fil_rev_8_21_14_0_20_64_6]
MGVKSRIEHGGQGLAPSARQGPVPDKNQTRQGRLQEPDHRRDTPQHDAGPQQPQNRMRLPHDQARTRFLRFISLRGEEKLRPASRHELTIAPNLRHTQNHPRIGIRAHVEDCAFAGAKLREGLRPFRREIAAHGFRGAVTRGE